MGLLPLRASSFPRSVGRRALWFTACLSCAAPAASAQIQKLNDALSRDYLGDVFTWQVSASGRVVFASSPSGNPVDPQQSLSL